MRKHFNVVPDFSRHGLDDVDLPAVRSHRRLKPGATLLSPGVPGAP
jgi:hypothetical protein